MSDRSQTIWNLIVGFSVVSIIAAGFKLFPMNEKYDRIKERSSNLQFGTDEELENVIAFLEERLEQRNSYQFLINKEPMVLTNVLSIDGSGRRFRRNKSSIRVALIYQRETNFQAQIDYRGKVFGVTSGEFIENIGEILSIDKNQVIIKNENKIMSYPAPGLDDGIPKELSNYIATKNTVLSNQSFQKNSDSIQEIIKTKKVNQQNNIQYNESVSKSSLGSDANSKKTIESNSNVAPKKSLVESMFNVAIAKKNDQSPNKSKPLFINNSNVPSTTVKTVKKPAVDYGVSALSPPSVQRDRIVVSTKKVKKRSKQLNEKQKSKSAYRPNTNSVIANKNVLKTKIKTTKVVEKYPTWKHELQVLLGLPKPAVNGNPGLMSFNELKVIMKSENSIDNSIFQDNYKNVGYDKFQEYLNENGENIIVMLRSKKKSSL